MVHAPEEALVHFQRALDVKEERPMDDETAALLFGLGTAQVATLEMHQMADAVVTLERAFDYFVEGGEMENALSIAESTVPRLLGLRTGMARFLERALELAPEDSLQNGRLLSRYGQELGGASGDYEAAQPAFNKALEIARRERRSPRDEDSCGLLPCRFHTYLIRRGRRKKCAGYCAGASI